MGGGRMIEIERIYDEKKGQSGYRVLVDRIWPRGLKKEDVKADLWLRDVAPSSELRKWFGHEQDKWPEFKKRYFRELQGKKDDINILLEKERQGKVILLFGAKDVEHNNAVALKEYLEKKTPGERAA